MEYSLFLGCTIPARLNNYEASARRVAELLDIKLVGIPGAGCCGPVHIRSLDSDTWILMAARNLALAERIGNDIVTLCNGCFSSLKDVNYLLHRDSELMERVNSELSELGLSFKGSIKVKHFVEVLYKDYGIDKIMSRVQKTFDGLKTAVYYGCHALRPSEITGFDNPNNPSILDRLVEITGAISVPWDLKLVCCGAPILAINELASLKLIKDKLESVKRAGAKCIVTICPFCEIMFDLQQLNLANTYGLKYDLPAFTLPQFLGLALGINPDDLGLYMNKIPADSILKKYL